MIEFMPWYQSGRAVVRCAGDDGCGAHVSEGDMELHLKWHQRVDRLFTPPVVQRLRRTR